eukprot:6592762-Prymnesium_polylepis.1
MLHQSPNCASGYKGVYMTKNGRFEVRLSTEGVHLGTHDTALEAAVVFARYLHQAPEPQGWSAGTADDAPSASVSQQQGGSTSTPMPHSTAPLPRKPSAMHQMLENQRRTLLEHQERRVHQDCTGADGTPPLPSSLEMGMGLSSDVQRT